MTATSRSSSSLTCPPLYGTPRTPSRPTLGPRVTETSELLGKPYIPWQNLVADVGLELKPNGLPAYHTVVIVVERQQGKTELLLPWMTHRSTGFDGPQRILYTTQTASKAREKWEDIHVARLQASPYASLFTVRLRLNAEAIMWANGSMWSPGSTTAKTGGTGDSLDLGVIDEAWSRPDNRTELGMRPAMLTRPKRQLVIASMVPGPTRAKTVDSAYLRQWIQIGRARVRAGMTEGIAYFEWSARLGMDPGDPATWWSCMPALGWTITEDTVRGDYETMVAAGELGDFEAEYLGWWPQDRKPTWTMVRELTWQGLEDPTSEAVGSVALTLDMDPEHTQAWICAAGKRADGDWHVEVLEPGQEIPEGTPGADWAERRLLDIVDRNAVCAVVIDPRSGAAPAIQSLRPKLAERGVPLLTPSTVDVAQACGRFYDAMGEKAAPAADGERPVRVRHLNQPELNRALAGARKLESPTYGTFIFARVGNAISISPLYGVTLAMHGYVVAAPDDYDLLDSVAGYDDECPECGASPAPGTERIEHDPECPLLS